MEKPMANRRPKQVVVQVAEHIQGHELTYKGGSRSPSHACGTCHMEPGENWCYEWHIHTTSGVIYGFNDRMERLPEPGTLVCLEPIKRGDPDWKFRDRWRIVKSK